MCLTTKSTRKMDVTVRAIAATKRFTVVTTYVADYVTVTCYAFLVNYV